MAGNQLPPAVSDVPGIQQIGLTLVEAHATGATCSDNSIVPIEVFAVPTAELGSDSLWCAGEAVLLQGAATGTGDLTFVWTSTFGTEWPLHGKSPMARRERSPSCWRSSPRAGVRMPSASTCASIRCLRWPLATRS